LKGLKVLRKTKSKKKVGGKDIGAFIFTEQFCPDPSDPPDPSDLTRLPQTLSPYYFFLFSMKKKEKKNGGVQGYKGTREKK